METFQFAMLRSVEAMKDIQDEWRALWTISHGCYFLSLQSCVQSWEAIHRPRGRTLECAVMRHDQRIVAIMPMVCYRRQGLWKVAQNLGPEAAEECNMVIAEDAPLIHAKAIFDYFIAQVRPDIMDLAYVVENSAMDRAVKASGKFYVVTQVEEMPCLILREETDWTTFERSLGRQYQRNTEKQLRRFEAKGKVDYEIVVGDADASIDWLLDTKQKWGETTKKNGPWLTSPLYRAYLKGFAATSGLITTYVINFNGKPAAVKVVFIGPVLSAPIIAAYDESLSYYSPGKILDGFYIKHVFENFRDTQGRHLNVEFGVGSELNKQHWSRGYTIPTRTYKVAASRWGEVPYRLKALVKRLRQTRNNAQSLNSNNHLP